MISDLLFAGKVESDSSTRYLVERGKSRGGRELFVLVPQILETTHKKSE